MADDPDREASEKSRAEFAERMKGKPTPTQAELDLAMVGANVLEKEDDGSGPDLHVRSIEAHKPAAVYQTRKLESSSRTPPPAPRRTEPE